MFLILHVANEESNSSCTVEGWLGPSVGVDQTFIKIHMCLAVYVHVKEKEGICSQMCFGHL